MYCCVFPVGGGKALQKQKPKKKAKELNRKGQEKEGGSDMDAFTSTPPVAPNATTAPVETEAPLPPVAATPTAVPATSVPPAEPPINPSHVERQPSPVPPTSQTSQQPLPTAPAPAPAPAPDSQTIIPPLSNKNVDNEVSLSNTLYLFFNVLNLSMPCIK